MRDITKIDLAKSSVTRKLVFNEPWTDKIDRILIYVYFGALILLSAFMILNADFNNTNHKISSLTFFPLTLLLSLYIVYRTLTEKRLIELTTQFDKEINRSILISFAERNKLWVSRDSKGCVILNTEFYRVSIIFIIEDNLMLFTTLTNGYRINFPTLIYNLILKHKLVNEFNSN